MYLRTLTICLLATLALTACGEDTNATNNATNNANGAADAGGDASSDAGSDTSTDAGSTSAHTASTTEGPVQGTLSSGVLSFLGIPYAQPPVGELRWKPPQAAEARADLLVADSFGPACPQDDSAVSFTQSGPTDEDCLTLNIWTPHRDLDALAPGDGLPVMFWIHGGGFIQGSARQTVTGGTELYKGADLAVEQAIVVTMNYRLGALGFLAHSAFIGEDGHLAAGNYGLLDQIQALEWVRDNIDSFGGDPDNITIFGESAGGVSVCALMASPLTAGMFDSAIMESGNCLSAMRKLDEVNGDNEAATDQGARLAESLDCDGAAAEDVAACMRGKTADQILEAMPATIGLLGGDGEGFEPIIDGHVLDKSLAQAIEDGSAHQVPFVIGANADEGTIFTMAQADLTEQDYEDLVNTYFPIIGSDVLDLYPVGDYDDPRYALSAIIGDVAFVCPARRTARAHAANGNDAFTYFFTYVSAAGAQFNLGAFHASEVAFVFGNFGSFGGAGAEATLTNAIQTWWIQLAYDGAPGSAEGHAWPAYDATAEEWMQLDTTRLGVTSGVRGEYCDFWASYL
jgi:para-nitrobenzyl esterase